jgi:uncharacterized phage protein (TIGR02218 family)
MKTTIPILLLNSFKKSGRDTCFLVKIVERDTGEAHGFGTADANVRFNDGEHDLLYVPDQELRPQNILNTSDFEVDNTELVGWFNEAIEQRVLAGRFNSAEITMYRVNYLNTALGAEVVAYGYVGRVDYSASSNGKRKIEYRSLTELLHSKQNDVWSLTCIVPFGGDDCGMPFEWNAGTIADVEDNFLRFQIAGVVAADGFFDLGVVIFDTGDNATYDMEVESWTADGWVTLSFVTPYPIANGINVRIRRDCNKTEQACKDYGNIVNMRAEHLTPLQDQALMVPGAYIKSQNAL